MGGSALKKYGVETKRMNTSELFNTFDGMKDDYKKAFNIDIVMPKSYHNKESHGDLDILIPKNKNINHKEYIIKTYNPKAIYHNGNVFSFDYNNFQVDFILVDYDLIEVAHTYLSFDPIGNLMGKTYHKFNLSYGWDGLKYKCRDENGYKMKTVTVSTNIRKIFEFGGFDYNRFTEGFDTLEEIYHFIINSKYFNLNTFLFENLAYKDKKRNRKRPSYNKFLKYVNENKLQFANHEFDKDKASYLPKIIEFFPEANLDKTLTEIEEKLRISKIIKNKFNGDMVMMWLPELKTGREIGQVIGNFKSEIEDFDDFIMKSTYIEIYNRFMEIYEEFKLQ